MAKILAHPLGFKRRPITLRNRIPKNHAFPESGCVRPLRHMYGYAAEYSTSIQKKTTEAGCQRGTNTYQCWPPLQLNDTIGELQVHKYTKSIKKKKKKNTASIQAGLPSTSSLVFDTMTTNTVIYYTCIFLFY